MLPNPHYRLDFNWDLHQLTGHRCIRVPVQVTNFFDRAVYIKNRKPGGILILAKMEPDIDIVLVGSNEAIIMDSYDADISLTESGQQLLSQIDIGMELDVDRWRQHRFEPKSVMFAAKTRTTSVFVMSLNTE